MYLLIFNLKISKQIGNSLIHFKTTGLKHKMKTSINIFFLPSLNVHKPHHTVLPLTSSDSSNLILYADNH